MCVECGFDGRLSGVSKKDLASDWSRAPNISSRLKGAKVLSSSRYGGVWPLSVKRMEASSFTLGASTKTQSPTAM